MRTQVPLAITFLTALLIVVSFFIPHDPFSGLQTVFLQWFSIIAGFSMIIGLISLSKRHANKITRRASGFGYSVILMIAMVVTLFLGFHSGIVYEDPFSPNAPFMWYYNYMFVPLSATMFSLLAFFIASAAYRAFRAKTLDATLLLLAGALVMIGRVPLGNLMWDKFPIIAEWIMQIPQMSAKRGILIGIALGMIVTSLRIMLGIERTYLK
jgi:cation transport ATPase